MIRGMRLTPLLSVAPATIQAYPVALIERFRGFSTRSLLLNPSAFGGYVGIGVAVATAATVVDGEAGSVADDAAGGGAPPHVTSKAATAIGAS